MKKWLNYFFNSVGIILLIGFLVSVILFTNNTNINSYILGIPIFVCCFCSIISLIVFIWIYFKEFSYIKSHIDKKLIFFHQIAVLIYVLEILYCLIIGSLVTSGLLNLSISNTNNSSIIPSLPVVENQTWIPILLIVIAVLFSLIAIGINEYSTWKIKLSLEKKRNPTNDHEVQKVQDVKKDIENKESDASAGKFYDE